MKHEDTGQHYRYSYKGIKLDPFRIALVYNLWHPAQLGILKKVLKAGGRGHNDVKEDVKDIICAAERWLEMIEEDEGDNEQASSDNESD